MEEKKPLNIDVEIKTGEDVQLFSQLLGAIIFDAAQDKTWVEWIKTGDTLSTTKAASVLVVPMLMAYMKSKELLNEENK